MRYLWLILLAGQGSAATSVSLTATPQAAVFGSPVNLSATVNPATAQGSVTFYDGGTILGSANLGSGTASLSVRFATTGVQRVFARYSGSMSAPVNVTVTSTAEFAFNYTTISGGWNNHETAVGNFNSDGIPDLVTASYGYIFVFPGDGHGNFGAPIQTTPPSSQPDMVSLVTGDFNRDGKLDLAMINGVPQPQNVTVWFGRGDGTFTLGPAITIDATSLAVGDFNGDGFADLAIGTGPAPGVSVLLSKGDGTFQAPRAYNVSGDQLGAYVAVADLNQDGNADLIAVTGVYSSPDINNRMNVLLGRGDGTFLQPAGWVDDPADAIVGPGSIAVGDLNGDGFPDLAIENAFSYVPYRCTVTVMTGNGDGTFQPPVRYPCSDTSQTSANGFPVGLLIADFDGDGKADVLGLYQYNQGYIQLFPGNGDGTLGGASVYSFAETLYGSGASFGWSSAMADFNGSGRIDFASSSDEGINVFVGGPGPLLHVTQAQTGVIMSGQNQAYTVAVSNDEGAAATSGTVSVTDGAGAPYSGVASMAGDGWTCAAAATVCTRSDPLSGGASYPPITVQIAVTVPYGSAGTLTNGAVVSGGGSPAAESDLTAPAIPQGSVSSITSVGTVGSSATSVPGIAPNGWIEINGINLVPATTPAAGAIWSDAPEFAMGQMPTQLDGVSVSIDGNPAYVEFYCSAASSTVCTSDQINVLSSLDATQGGVEIVVTSGTGKSPQFLANLNAVSPAFLRFGGSRYVTATHSDYSLLGPASLYPGYTTPAAPGEVVLLWAVGFGLPVGALTEGSASQTGTLPGTLACTVGGNPAEVSIALVSPGLYQMNLTVPVAAASGDDPVSCVYGGMATPDGTLLTVN
ncbi:MAG: FG-GAP-like repeat-containing protein [Bryobacteraceae bacterium]